MLSVSAMNPRAKVLVVEDEEPLALLLRYNLEAEGYAVDVVHRGDEAEVAIAESSPDLIVLDWMLPGLSGLELCRRLRTGKDSRTIPIILLTARSEESDRIRGLTTGADDYVVKPFSLPELMARVRAILRRTSPDRSSPDLIVLDWMLPGLSGLELCRRLRTGKDSRTIPIILLTARSEESDRIRGLTTGADDYVVKPFSLPELMARVRAILRRTSPERI